MVTPKDLAERLNKIQYRTPIAESITNDAKAFGLVIVMGASDDLLEFEGAIYDEIGAYNGVMVMFDKDGMINGCDEACEHCSAVQRGLNAKLNVDAKWSQNGYSWFIESNIPKAAYFDVLEDDEKYCRGVVFALEDLK